MTTETREAMAARHAQELVALVTAQAVEVARVLALPEDERAAAAFRAHMDSWADFTALTWRQGIERNPPRPAVAYMHPDGAERVVRRVKP